MQFTRDAEIALTEAYQPQGINIGVNLGRAAGAGILEHVHIHLVPRWIGDTNFMPVIGEVRVLPEELGESARRLRPVFERLAREHTVNRSLRAERVRRALRRRSGLQRRSACGESRSEM